MGMAPGAPGMMRDSPGAVSAVPGPNTFALGAIIPAAGAPERRPPPLPCACASAGAATKQARMSARTGQCRPITAAVTGGKLMTLPFSGQIAAISSRPGLSPPGRACYGASPADEDSPARRPGASEDAPLG